MICWTTHHHLQVVAFRKKPENSPVCLCTALVGIRLNCKAPTYGTLPYPRGLQKCKWPPGGHTEQDRGQIVKHCAEYTPLLQEGELLSIPAGSACACISSAVPGVGTALSNPSAKPFNIIYCQ